MDGGTREYFKSFKTLLEVSAIEMTGAAYNLVIESRAHEMEFYLDDDGILTETECADFENEKKYLFINLNTLDNILSNEISAIGLIDMFDDIDLRPFLEKLPIRIDDNNHPSQYLIVSVSYEKTYDAYSGGYEYSSYTDVLGVLNQEILNGIITKQTET